MIKVLFYLPILLSGLCELGGLVQGSALRLFDEGKLPQKPSNLPEDAGKYYNVTYWKNYNCAGKPAAQYLGVLDHKCAPTNNLGYCSDDQPCPAYYVVQFGPAFAAKNHPNWRFSVYQFKVEDPNPDTITCPNEKASIEGFGCIITPVKTDLGNKNIDKIFSCSAYYH